MKHKSKLEELLYNQDEDQKNDFNTQSIYQSLEIQKGKEIEFDENSLEIEIRNKLTKIVNSLKSFNVNLTHEVPRNYELSNKFICQLLDSVGEMIWKLEDEYTLKVSYVSKMGQMKQKLDEAEKRVKRLNSEIADFKKNELEQMSL